MTKFASSQRPASPKPHPATAISLDRDSGEYLWMKRNKKLDHQRRTSESNLPTSFPDGTSFPSAEESGTVARGIVGNYHVSISPWTNGFSNDPNKARALATSTAASGIRVCSANIFSQDFESQISNTVYASRKSDEATDSTKEGNSLRSDNKGIKSLPGDGVSTAKAKQQTGEQSKMRQGGVGALKEFGKVPAGLVLDTQNSGPGDTKIHAHSVNTSYSQELLGGGDVARYFNSSNFLADWGTEKDIDVDSLLGDVNEHKTNKPEDAFDTNRLSSGKGDLTSQIENADSYLLLNETATKMSEGDQHSKFWAEGRLFSADTALASLPVSDNCSRLLETEPEGGNGDRQQAMMAGNTIIVTTSIKQIITPNTGVAENNKFKTEIKAISPSNVGNTYTASCLTPMSSGDRATSILRKTQIGVAQLKPPSINVDNADKMELPEPHPLFNPDLDDLLRGSISPTFRGSEDIASGRNTGQLSVHGLDTLFSNSVDRNKCYGGTDVNYCLPPMSKSVFRRDTEETTAKDNYTQPETGSSRSTTLQFSSFSKPPLSAVGGPVAKICTPSTAETDVQVELAVEAKKPCDDSKAKSFAAICGIDVDFDLNDGALRMTEEDIIRLGLHNLSWAKPSDATTSPPSISTEDLHEPGNTCKESPFLVGGAYARDDSGENVTENKTGIDMSDPWPPVANADSLRNMEFDPTIHCSGACGSQDSPGDEDAIPGNSPDCPPTKARHVPQTYDCPRKLNATDSISAGGSIWVKVELDTNDLLTQMDIVEGE